jgi:4-amino-4-deoxy-L-arabinose transferase-like glycosyltransferase
MQTAESPQAPDAGRARRAAGATGALVTRRWAWAGLACVLAGGLGLRLWGVRQGLPFAFNTDEADHFVSKAVAMFREGTLNPHYFSNPPAFTYLLHGLFALAYGGSGGVQRAFSLHPSEVYTLARIAAAGLGTAALWLLYAVGARLFNRGVGLLAAAIEAVAFLPVFYAHLALNDVPTLAPLTLSLLGSAGILRRGRMLDHVVAGVGLGLACATKYTAGIALVPLLAAVASRFLDGEEAAARMALLGLLVAGSTALLTFLLANPYAILDYQGFHAGLVHQSSLSGESQGKLGAPRSGGVLYYLWSLTWGLGWVPALAALGGAVTVWRAERRLGWLLVPPAVLFLLFMGTQGRYFGRWLMPVLPILCLLAAHFALTLPGLLARRRRPARLALATVIVLALLAQGLIYSVHAGLVLSRADTRSLTRAWMLAHIPANARIVVEPIAPEEWAHESRPGTSTLHNPRRWRKYDSLLPRISPSGRVVAPISRVSIENYERTLAPELIGYYLSQGYCWVVSGSTQAGRAFADPRAVPQAIAYYRALAAGAEVVFRASPYPRGRGPVAFSFDWSFDYYPLAYRRPGPAITVYRLHGGRCG